MRGEPFRREWEARNALAARNADKLKFASALDGSRSLPMQLAADRMHCIAKMSRPRLGDDARTK